MSLLHYRHLDIVGRLVTVRLYEDATLMSVNDNLTYVRPDGGEIDFATAPSDAGARAAFLRIQVLFNAQAVDHQRNVVYNRVRAD